MVQQVFFMELKLILESLLMVAPKPFSVSELRDVLTKAGEEEGADEAVRAFRKLDLERLEAALAELAREHAAAARSYRLVCVAGAWQFVTLPAFAPWARAFLGVKNRPSRLSQPALETLAVIAYRQPVTRAEMEQIRGVAVDGVIATLKERGLIEEAGRAEVVGRPMQYATTAAFLEYFGLASLDELPAADELRRISVSRPEALMTVDTPPNADPAQLPLSIPDAPLTPAPNPSDVAREVMAEAESKGSSNPNASGLTDPTVQPG